MEVRMSLSTDQTELDQRWDLSRLYHSPSDPRIDEDLRRSRRQAESLRSFFLGKVGTSSPIAVAKVLEGLDDLSGTLNRLFSYSYLLFSSDTQEDINKDLYARIQREVPEIKNAAVFFDLEIQHMPEAAFQELLKSPVIAEYVDHLGRIRRVAEHALDEFSERIITLKDSVGEKAWIQLFFETTADFRIRLEMPNQPEELTLSAAYALRESNDRELRKRAFDATLEAHAQNQRPLTFVFNALFENYRHMMGLRQYDHPFAPLLVEENLPPGTIETLMNTVEGGYHLLQRYYRAKAAVLGLPDFASHDIRAQYPMGSSFIPFEEGRDIVVDSLTNFSPKLGGIARGFFEEGYIDAHSRPGKRAGAYCLSSGPTFHPYIFLNYNYTLKDVIVMAHEMGHGVHNVVSGQRQSLTNCDRVTMFMETPSIFSETLTFNRLLALEMNPETRQTLLGSQIEASILKIYKSVAITRFQLYAYERRKEGVLPAAEFCRLWGAVQEEMYGDAVELSPWDQWEWLTFHHTLNLPFYDYAYSFGQLLVYALMRRFQEEGPNFEPMFLELLGSGTSVTIGPLLLKVGVDLNDPNFWQQGLDYLEQMISEFESTIY
jgi:oligoendopeptidase F